MGQEKTAIYIYNCSESSIKPVKEKTNIIFSLTAQQ